MGEFLAEQPAPAVRIGMGEGVWRPAAEDADLRLHWRKLRIDDGRARADA